MERSFGQAMGQGPIYSEFGRDVQANFGQQDGLSYYGIPRQIGPQSRPLIQGVDALFQDYRGGSQGPLEFDFNGTTRPLLRRTKPYTSTGTKNLCHDKLTPPNVSFHFHPWDDA